MANLTNETLTEVPVVVLDTETTGLYPAMGHRVVEVAAVRLDPGGDRIWQVNREFNQLIHPGRHMDPDASRVNGIYDHDLVGAPPFSAIAGDLMDLLDGALCVAHNATFDAGFLSMEFYIFHLTTPDSSLKSLSNPWLCTLQLARRFFHFGNNSLGHVARQLGVRYGRAHRAMNDVYTTLEILKRMGRDLAQLGYVSVADLLYAQGGPIYAMEPPAVPLPEPLNEAIARRRPVHIEYMGYTGSTQRIIQPLYATYHQGSIYLVAYCHLRDDQRTFRLDRIRRAEIVDGGT